MNEFSLINQYFSKPAQKYLEQVPHEIELGIGDDCALIKTSASSSIAVSVDTLVEGVHFPKGAPPEQLGKRALAVSISDLAAMGAKPVAFTLALTIPEVKKNWMEQFSQGLLFAAQKFDCKLVGGDTTRGPLTITIQVMGTVPSGEALTRGGAAVGDRIFVTGPLGDSAAGLAILQKQLVLDTSAASEFIERYYFPLPKLKEGQLLRNIASAAIDISDGLMADLGHIADASEVSALIRSEDIPVSESLREYCSDDQLLNWALTGGDDYHLCFTVPQNKLAKLHECMAGNGIAAIEIGEIIARAKTNLVVDSARDLHVARRGYQHFE